MHNLGNNDTQAGTSPGRNYVSAFPLLLETARRIRVPPLVVNPADVSSFRGGFIKFCKNNSDASPSGIPPGRIRQNYGRPSQNNARNVASVSRQNFLTGIAVY